jgi:hypothetical protein
MTIDTQLSTMTHEAWKLLSSHEREVMRDNTRLNPKLIGLEGKRVRVTPKRTDGYSTFRVGKTTGWRPVHLAMRSNAYGSSDIVSHTEHFESVTVLN